MIYILIMQLRGASFILQMKSRVLLRSEVGMIMVSICLHGVISWSQASGRGRFSPTKTVIAEKHHPSVLKFCLTWTVCNISNKMTKFYDDVYSFERVRGCQLLKLYISMFEKWLESPQWLLAVSKPKVRMCVTSAWGQELSAHVPFLCAHMGSNWGASGYNQVEAGPIFSGHWIPYLFFRTSPDIIGYSRCPDFSGHVRRRTQLPKLTRLLTSAISVAI